MQHSSAQKRAPMRVKIDAFWDDEAGVWCASSEDVHGLAIGDKTIDELVARLQIIVPELMELNHPGETLAENGIKIVYHGEQTVRCVA